jgi:tetratricopeptide (TPR) repeat protein
MQRRFRAASLVVLAGLVFSLAGCSAINQLKARRAFKEANQYYMQQDYTRAAERYKETVDTDPAFGQAYFYLANSYDNLYKVSHKGEKQNDQYLTDAVHYYKVASEKDPDPRQRNLALQFLVNAYGPDKLDDPGEAVPVIEKMIQADPRDTTNYFRLSKIYEDSGMYNEAEQYLLKAKEVRPNDPLVYQQLAGFYNREGDFDKTIEAYQSWKKIDPNNPEVYYTIASFYWDAAYHDTRLKEPQKKQMVATGMEEVDKALSLKPDYIDALVRKGLLLRLEASFEKTRTSRYDDLMKQAKDLNDKAVALQKRKASGIAQ